MTEKIGGSKMVKHQHVLAFEKFNFAECLSPTGFPFELVPEGSVNPPMISTNPADNDKYPAGSMQKFCKPGRKL